MTRLGPLALVAGATLLVACTGAAAPSPAAAPLAASRPAATAARETAPQNDYDAPVWQELIAAAQHEGHLVLASGPSPDTRRLLPAAFKERFGLSIEYLGGRSSELQTRLRGEREAGV